MRLVRHYDWPERLNRVLEAARSAEFGWGTFDCALHVANCIRGIVTSGVDVGASYRGKYSDEASAIAIFGTDLGAFAATIAATFGMEEVMPTLARRGDVVFVDNSTPQFPSPYGALGIVSMDGRFAACASTKGLVHVHMQRWKRAWRVG
jgi:hypothetical protein